MLSTLLTLVTVFRVSLATCGSVILVFASEDVVRLIDATLGPFLLVLALLEKCVESLLLSRWHAYSRSIHLFNLLIPLRNID